MGDGAGAGSGAGAACTVDGAATSLEGVAVGGTLVGAAAASTETEVANQEFNRMSQASSTHSSDSMLSALPA